MFCRNDEIEKTLKYCMAFATKIIYYLICLMLSHRKLIPPAPSARKRKKNKVPYDGIDGPIMMVWYSDVSEDYSQKNIPREYPRRIIRYYTIDTTTKEYSRKNKSVYIFSKLVLKKMISDNAMTLKSLNIDDLLNYYRISFVFENTYSQDHPRKRLLP